MKRALAVTLLLAALAASAIAGMAQSGSGYDLSWWSVDAGGGSRDSGGGYTLASTAGQPDAAEAGGGGYTLSGGFLAGVDTPPVDQPISGLAASSSGPTSLGQPTIFTATVSSGSGISYQWAFGDSSSGSGDAPSHTYAAAGQYIATVSGINAANQLTATTVVIVQQPISGLTAGNNGPTQLGQPTSFTASAASGSGVTYEWAFGDGGIASGAAPSHVYAAPGQYPVTVTANNLVSSQSAGTTAVVRQEWAVYLPVIIR